MIIIILSAVTKDLKKGLVEMGGSLLETSRGREQEGELLHNTAVCPWCVRARMCVRSHEDM